MSPEDRLYLDEPCPCEGCLFVERCREQFLACAAFAQFTAGEPERVWSRTYREPSHETYMRLMS